MNFAAATELVEREIGPEWKLMLGQTTHDIGGVLTVRVTAMTYIGGGTLQVDGKGASFEEAAWDVIKSVRNGPVLTADQERQIAAVTDFLAKR